ncbi:hypothetical protein PoB_000216600 [Plakobranchus ocellatus]|uniref:Uncharacterized protein n=1 Tax=Plakobranchus ocellatus TaxID=259542 RepID=A0AAV3XXU2_9GAST|nr:hypothetical protein PoB_000216600 [Plakobranchus ocellatus]
MVGFQSFVVQLSGQCPVHRGVVMHQYDSASGFFSPFFLEFGPQCYQQARAVSCDCFHVFQAVSHDDSTIPETLQSDHFTLRCCLCSFW